jgi:hypothetical protein
MKSLPNIEKSAFRRHEYVGYGGGCVYRVRKCGTGGWEAWLGNGALDGMSQGYLRARTLEAMSLKLRAFDGDL